MTGLKVEMQDQCPFRSMAGTGIAALWQQIRILVFVAADCFALERSRGSCLRG